MGSKVGLYGGTFDPVHFGHINLALEMLEKDKVDSVLFCPAQISPFKQGELPVSGEHRVNMIERAIAGIPKISVIKNELNRPGPSYTIDTLKELIKEAALHTEDVQFYLILGEDALPSLHRWHKIEEIIDLVPLLIGTRSNEKKESPQGSKLDKAIAEARVNTRVLDISATDIRNRLSTGLYCGHLVHKEVLDYIREFQLYLHPYE